MFLKLNSTALQKSPCVFAFSQAFAVCSFMVAWKYSLQNRRHVYNLPSRLQNWFVDVTATIDATPKRDH